MSNSIDYHLPPFYFEENPIVSYPKPEFRGEGSKALDITGKVIRHNLNLFNDPASFAFVHCP